VHHEPVAPAVGYRVETPDGVVAVSGDTRACDEVVELARGADVLVHEALLPAALAPFHDALPHLRHVARYHADAAELGPLARRAGVATLVLTHLIPAPCSPADERAFVDAVRSGGFTGEVVVGQDLTTVTIG
jgi:ribonuclease Z